MHTPVKPMHATEDQLTRIAGMLGRAFFADPLYTYIYPDVDERRNRLSYDFAFLARYGHRFGAIIVTPEGTGCAIWLPPAATAFLPERAAQIRMPFPAPPLSDGARARWDHFTGTIDRLHHQLMPDPHWYLLIIGVEAAYQGQGIGSAVLAPIVAQADQAGQPCYLETLQVKNLSFYKKNGFAVVREVDLPGAGRRIWFLRHPPG
jgi:GNAT superfamily N-acetyltransferase